jgi:PAS domain S-box-containing protein
MIKKPIPNNREINVNPAHQFNCKISTKGTLIFTSHVLCELNGFEEYELIGEPITSLIHPEMPKVFFDVLTERLALKELMRIFVKLITKDGSHYWLMMDFHTRLDEKGNIVAHYSESVAANPLIVQKLQILYKILAKIEEKTGNTKASKRYLVGYLEERNITYDQFVEELSELSNYAEQEVIQAEDQGSVRQPSQLNSVNEYKTSYNLNLDVTAPIVDYNSEVKPKKKSLFRRIFG